MHSKAAIDPQYHPRPKDHDCVMRNRYTILHTDTNKQDYKPPTCGIHPHTHCPTATTPKECIFVHVLSPCITWLYFSHPIAAKPMRSVFRHNLFLHKKAHCPSLSLFLFSASHLLFPTAHSFHFHLQLPIKSHSHSHCFLVLMMTIGVSSCEPYHC